MEIELERRPAALPRDSVRFVWRLVLSFQVSAKPVSSKNAFIPFQLSFCRKSHDCDSEIRNQARQSENSPRVDDAFLAALDTSDLERPLRSLACCKCFSKAISRTDVTECSRHTAVFGRGQTSKNPTSDTESRTIAVLNYNYATAEPQISHDISWKPRECCV